ncbi:hypothetical protein ACJ73_07375, partial [Blastomyces percursus]
MRLGINHIDKVEFLALYPAVQMQALNENNIKSGFGAAGLVPYDPEQVLSRLNTTMKNPTPLGPLIASRLPRPQQRLMTYASWSGKLRRSRNISSTQEVKELRAANAKKIKRDRGRTYVAQEGALGVEEGLDCVRRVNELDEEVGEASDSQPRKRAASRCSS